MARFSRPQLTALNGICPYFTMFPLEFPLRILERRAKRGDRVLDPFCGRGTTSFAARLRGLASLGIDSSPVAAAITASKLASTTAEAVVSEARRILEEIEPRAIPTGEFWNAAYHPAVLADICRFRRAFLDDCNRPASLVLRGIILGALHGPKQKRFPSYFSNQCPRTYAPKPAYATRYWHERNLLPEPIDVVGVIERRAQRYLAATLPNSVSEVRMADSRDQAVLQAEQGDTPYQWIITSPPYYGMRTYIPDQWLRSWFIGGPSIVDYQNHGQVVHSSPDEFAADLRQVWRNVGTVSSVQTTMVVRFGGIRDRGAAEPLCLLRESFRESGWRITTMRKAGSAKDGRRQADGFLRKRTKPIIEYDVWARPE